MSKTRKKYSPEFKVKAVLKVLRGDKTASQVAGELGVHPLVLSDWKKHFLAEASQVFEKPGKTSNATQQVKEKSELFEQIGRLNMEVEWLKKKLNCLT